MSDTEQEWKPSGRPRPQSTMAQAFSTALDSAFSLDSEVDNLSQSIDQKKYQMLIQNRELEELQARIRAAEARLKNRQSVHMTPAPVEEGEEESQESVAGQEESVQTEGQEQEEQEQQQEEVQTENGS